MATINDPIEYMNLKETFRLVREGGDKFIKILDQYTEISLEKLWLEYIHETKLANKTGNTYNIINSEETGSTYISTD